MGINSQNFDGVQVDIPNGKALRGQDASFVMWIDGCVTVDEDNEVRIVSQGAKTQNLGCLKRASAVAQDEKSQTLIIVTDSVPGIYRLTFQTAADARRLTKVADAIEKVEAEAWEENRRERAKRADVLARDVRAALNGTVSLVYKNAELFGTDPGSEEGGEVLLGSGVVVLLDAPGEGHIGSYDVVFYSDEEGAHTPLRTLPIGPKTRMKRRERERAILDDEEEAAIIFDIRSMGGCSHAIAFDDIGQAAEFQRDFEVRQRVMALAARCTEQERSLSEAVRELEGFRNPGTVAHIWSRTRTYATIGIVPIAMCAYNFGKWLC